MKLSEAIRLGSMLRPQSVSCALAAAREAAGDYDYCMHMSGSRILWPWIDTTSACPECSEAGMVYGVIALHLNDLHHWSRERIADWVATIEPEESLFVVVEETLEALEAAK